MLLQKPSQLPRVKVRMSAKKEKTKPAAKKNLFMFESEQTKYAI
jgi:hypothetical protein